MHKIRINWTSQILQLSSSSPFPILICLFSWLFKKNTTPSGEEIQTTAATEICNWKILIMDVITVMKEKSIMKANRIFLYMLKIQQSKIWLPTRQNPRWPPSPIIKKYRIQDGYFSSWKIFIIHLQIIFHILVHKIFTNKFLFFSTKILSHP